MQLATVSGRQGMKVYGDRWSGNCYKVKLLLNLLGIAYEWQEIEVTSGVTRKPDFLAMNPNGRVPVLEIEPGTWLAESNAILCYLAEGTPYLPTDRLERGRAMQWLFFEQYSHEPYIATSRYWIRYLGKAEEYREQLAAKRPGGEAALAVMEGELARRDWFAGGRYTIADIALYAYTHVAHEGGFDLAPYKAVRAWLARVARQPGHVEMG
jgi:glutathione S-transferase